MRLSRITNNTKLPRDWKSFLRSDSNKTLLVSYLAEEVLSAMKDDGKTIVFTIDDKVRSVPERDNSRLQPCNHEEADTRMFLHMNDSAMEDDNAPMTFLFITNDTDVVVNSVVAASRSNLQI